MSAEYKPVAFALFRDGDIDWDDDELQELSPSRMQALRCRKQAHLVL